MECCDSEKGVTEVGIWLCSICIQKVTTGFSGNPSRPGTVVIEMRPLPSLASEERDTTYYSPDHPFYYPPTIVCITGANGKNHCNRTHDQDKGHETHKYKRQVVTNQWKRLENMIRVRPAVGRKSC